MNKNKGVTLVELIVILGLIGIIITPVFTLLISNLKTYNRLETQLELSYEAQKISKYLLDNTIESNSIDVVNSFKLTDGQLNHNGIVIANYVDVLDIDKENDNVTFNITLKKDNLIKEFKVKVKLRNVKSDM